MTMGVQRIVETVQREKYGSVLKHEDKMMASVWEQGCEMHVF